MSIVIESSWPAVGNVAAADRLNAASDDQEYRRGRTDGLVWARDYATAGELRDLVQNFEPCRDGDFDTPYCRGFVAGAEEGYAEIVLLGSVGVPGSL